MGWANDCGDALTKLIWAEDTGKIICRLVTRPRTKDDPNHRALALRGDEARNLDDEPPEVVKSMSLENGGTEDLPLPTVDPYDLMERRSSGNIK